MRRTVNAFIGILVMLTFSACADVSTQTVATATITVPNDHLIVPGVRMGPFVLGMTETQLLAMGRPSARFASSLVVTDNSGNAPVVLRETDYCYWDQVVCVEVNQTNHLVQAIYTEGAYTGGSCPYKTLSGVTCGSSAAQVAQALELGEPDGSESQYHPYNIGPSDLYGRLARLGFQNLAMGTVTHIFFNDSGSSMASPIYTYVRGISITYKNYGGEYY